jgi:uncharacterized protein
VKVRVVEIDIARKRIALSMRSDSGRKDSSQGSKPEPREDRKTHAGARQNNIRPERVESHGALGAALAEALRKR